MRSVERSPLGAVANFRDLGGYRTRDGRAVKWGRLFRSGALTGLSDRQRAALGRLGLKLVLDLRSAAERAERAAPPWSGASPAIVEVPIEFAPMDPALIRARILGRAVERGEFARRLRAAYEAYATDFAAQYAAVVTQLADPGRHPALIHCREGKDRTGFAAALVLLGLGVPEEAVREDYLLTNRLTAVARRRTAALVVLASRFAISPREARSLLEARAEYLGAALDTIRARHGSIEAYLRDGLGVDATTWDRLRDALLE